MNIFKTTIKYRIVQPLLMIALLFVHICYIVLLISMLPIIILVSFHWKNKTFWDVISWYFDLIPKLPYKEDSDEV